MDIDKRTKRIIDKCSVIKKGKKKKGRYISTVFTFAALQTDQRTKKYRIDAHKSKETSQKKKQTSF